MACHNLLFAVCLFATTALADDPAWMQASAVAQATGADVLAARGSLLAIGPHADALERALADGATAPPPGTAADGKVLVLTDGPVESLMAMGAAIKSQQNAVAQPNPYPDIALYLALYYNEVHRYDDALKTIAAGVALAHTPNLGLHLPKLFTERATAYAGLKRFDEALASCEAGLTLAAADVHDKARMQRCRGFDLTELGRLDDAESAYKESLKLEPSNPLATRELAYVEHLKAGGHRAPTEQLNPPKQGDNAPGAKPI